MRILKFGGKSLDTIQKTQKICKYIKKIYKKEKEIIIVVSAIGKTTDNLINKAKTYSSNNPTEREMAKLLSTGETESSCLFSLMLNSIKVPAMSFQASDIALTTTMGYLDSQINSIDKTKIVSCLKEKTIAVVAGFQGMNSKNEITTLGRGGSDTTAIALGVAFNNNVEIYSDFDGVFCGDPRVLNYKKIKRINFKTMHIMSNAGAKVLTPRATLLALKNNIQIISKASRFPAQKGTIVSNIESNTISITSQNNLCLISIIFDNDKQLKFILKNVNNAINNYKIYNLNLKSNIIQILVNNEDSKQINYFLSKKLNLLK